ncbi:MAG: hypothetical protein OQK66_07135 [Prosthecochloris sp.]|uniref:hypothetical protein n=1 Tax=unclassified Prosthecochloris TaxID=2632826 RepID=UPI000DF86316|nr:MULTISPECIES: hypothetical protein [unclassified Prosthecochloris]MCW8798726.1 hypothetical protein [Prosthecochloris sp.]NEX12497.1 hypothetical protein [Prosthecochloris sp.]RDD30515.1 hypothetical protein CR161_07185 [Prosthecochloris sp. ZM]
MIMLKVEIDELERRVDAVHQQLEGLIKQENRPREMNESARQQLDELLFALSEDIQVFQQALGVMQSLLCQER